MTIIRTVHVYDPEARADLLQRLDRLCKGVSVVAPGDGQRLPLTMSGAIVDRYSMDNNAVLVLFNSHLIQRMGIELPQNGWLALGLLERIGFGSKPILSVATYQEDPMRGAVGALASVVAGTPADRRAAAHGALSIRHRFAHTALPAPLQGAVELLDQVALGEPAHLEVAKQQLAFRFAQAVLAIPQRE